MIVLEATYIRNQHIEAHDNVGTWKKALFITVNRSVETLVDGAQGNWVGNAAETDVRAQPTLQGTPRGAGKRCRAVWRRPRGSEATGSRAVAGQWHGKEISM